MTTSADSTAIDQAKSPLPDPGHDVVRIAEALRRSPHIHSVDDTMPGDAAVWFRDASGTGYTLSLSAPDPIMTDEPPGEAYVWDAVAAAIGNHPNFVDAKYKGFGADRVETITALTRTGNEYTLTMTLTPRPRSGGDEEPPVPVDRILEAVGQLRSRSDHNPDAVVLDKAADLLEHLAGTWDQQDDQTRQRAVALALSLAL
ncbi:MULTISPECIES: hypothetical protein [Streptomyces]|uniref:hypothetical protein n=1 Tax=Streptomyces scabiei TaxID=1930 RepID=UPI001B338DED|nr:hypothetical protein [Streptomyces sp. LBUM 1487]MBP5888810.1 hypothetical protein [Streptomyces sp. LBUM 1487]